MSPINRCHRCIRQYGAPCAPVKIMCLLSLSCKRLLGFFRFRYVEIAELLVKSGSKIDYRAPTDELYPRTLLCDEPLRLALKNRHYVCSQRLFLLQSISYFGRSPMSFTFFLYSLILLSIHFWILPAGTHTLTFVSPLHLISSSDLSF